LRNWERQSGDFRRDLGPRKHFGGHERDVQDGNESDKQPRWPHVRFPKLQMDLLHAHHQGAMTRDAALRRVFAF
jgi:hypothetical protein